MQAFQKISTERVQNDFSLLFSDETYGGVLTASTEYVLTVPNAGNSPDLYPFNKKMCLAIFNITPGAEVWLAVNATATVPSTPGAIAETFIKPGDAFAVSEGDKLHIITSGTGKSVGVSFYALT